MNKYIFIIILILFILLNFYYFNANPGIVNLTKSEILDYIREFVPNYRVINKNTHDMEYFKELVECLKYPLIFKPDFCHNFANGVKLIFNSKEALEYINKSIDDKIIIQDYHKGPYEGTIYYKKHPITDKIEIVVVDRQPNNSDKDGYWLWKSSVYAKENGYKSIHRPDLETEELKQKINYISSYLPGTFFGRYDVRFDSYSNLKKGIGFKILEFNELASDTRTSEDKPFLYNMKLYIIILFTRMKFGFINSFNPEYMNVIRNLEHSLSCLIKIGKCKQEKYIFAFLKKMHSSLKY